MLLVGAFLSGFVFGIGLLISDMVNPIKILAFLDIFGKWDPSLAVVMAAALAVTGSGYALSQRRGRPIFVDRIYWPMSEAIDGRLVAGAATFGIGWGLVGLCPGPALENLVTLSPPLLVFIAAMIAGMMLQDAMRRLRMARKIRNSAAASADG